MDLGFSRCVCRQSEQLLLPDLAVQETDDLVRPLLRVTVSGGVCDELIGFRRLSIAKRGELANQGGVDRKLVAPADLFEQLSRFS